MNKYFSAMLAVCLLICNVAFAAQTQDNEDNMVVTGTWVAGPNSGADFGWKKTGTQLAFLVSPQLTPQLYKVTRTEPLPQDDYTIDMWYQSISNYDTISLCIGDPKTNHNRPVITLNDYTKRGLPVKWVRLSCSPSRDLFAITCNGSSSIRNASDVGSDLAGQFSLVVQSGRWDTNSTEALRILSFTVTPGIGPEFGVAGPAFSGWSSKIKPDAIENISSLGSQIDSLYDSAKTDAGKSYALASRILVEYASTGFIGNQTWTKLSDMVQEFLPRERSGLAIILPIAAACADNKQKEQIKGWSKLFFDVQDLTQWQNLKINSDTEEKALLLDPISATRMSQSVSYRTCDYWTKALKQTAPQFSSLAVMNFLDKENWKTETIAWMLPDICSASTTLGKSAINVIKESANEQTPQPGEPDRRLSFAAYRLAKSDPVSSAMFLAMIKDPEVKADTIYYIGKTLSESDSLDPKMVESIESLMRQSIAEWKPTKTHTSPVDVMMRLVRFLDSQKKTEKAQELLNQAIAKIDQSSNDATRDIVDIARFKRQTKADDYQAWWDKAVNAAVAADEAYGMPDNSEGIYMSNLTLMVWDLVKEDKLDEAVTLVKKLDPEMMKNNRGMSLDRIIVKMLKTNIDGALSLLSEYPEMKAKNGITGIIAAKIAPTDLPKALDLLKTMPASSRTSALLRIASVLPSNQVSSILDELKPSIAAGVKPGGSFTWLFSNDSVGRYADLPVSTLLSLADAFEKSPDLLAVYLLANIVKHCELDKDPIWVQYWGINRTGGNDAGIPWGTSKLRYAVEAE